MLLMRARLTSTLNATCAPLRTQTVASLYTQKANFTVHASSERVAKAFEGRLALSFSGCGFLVPYQLGAVKVFQEHGPWHRVDYLLGVSGGAVTAALAGCLDDPSDISTFVEDFSFQGRNLSGLEQALPHDAAERANRRVVVGFTRLADGRSVQSCSFASRDSLLAAVRASCDIPRDFHPLDMIGPGWTKLHEHSGSKYVGGQAVCDGGLSKSLLSSVEIDGLAEGLSGITTISISPFSGKRKDVCPDSEWFGSGFVVKGQHMECSVKNIRRFVLSVVGGSPQTRPLLEQQFEAGCADTEQWLKSNHMYR